MDRAFLPKVLFALTLIACGHSKSSTETPGSRGDGGATPTADANTPADDDATLDEEEEDASRDSSSPLPDASSTERDAGADAGGQVGTPSGSPVFVAVGYSGRRVRSLDLGLTWGDEAILGGGGDDQNLLRAVAFGRDMFVAVGWKILTSPDGRTWTERTMPVKQWVGGLAFGNGRFVGAGGYGTSIYSTDGVTWKQGGNIATEASRSVAFGGDTFFAATGSNWWRSSEGTAWQVANAGQTQSQIAYCSGSVRAASQCSGHFTSRSRASGEGVIVRVDDGNLQRSTDDGASFTMVLRGDFESVAFGHAK